MNKKRRIVIKIFIALTVPAALFFSMRSSLYYKIKERLKRVVKKKHKTIPHQDRRVVKLPIGGEMVSVETALNSRCNSDSRGNQLTGHWGQFVVDGKFDAKDLKHIIDLAGIKHIVENTTRITYDSNRLTFQIDNRKKGIDRRIAMIHSGMQQQAVGLVCAALGAGLVFQNMSKNGKMINQNNYGTVRMLLGPIHPPYSDSYWIEKAPKKRKPWKKGNIPDPSRKGSNSLIKMIKEVRLYNTSDIKANLNYISQLLWAARGRTPHYYKSKPWGLTIPFWTDKIDVASVFLIKDDNVYRVTSWENDRPTHSLKKLNQFDSNIWKSIKIQYPKCESVIALTANDPHARALWEVGYCALNIILQAHALNISYSAVFVNNDNVKWVKDTGLENIQFLVFL